MKVKSRFFLLTVALVAASSAGFAQDRSMSGNERRSTNPWGMGSGTVMPIHQETAPGTNWGELDIQQGREGAYGRSYSGMEGSSVTNDRAERRSTNPWGMGSGTVMPIHQETAPGTNWGTPEMQQGREGAYGRSYTGGMEETMTRDRSERRSVNPWGMGSGTVPPTHQETAPGTMWWAPEEGTQR